MTQTTDKPERERRGFLDRLAMRLHVKPAVLLALVIAAGTAAWVLSGQMGDASTPRADEEPPVGEIEAERGPMSVRVRTSVAESRLEAIVVRGQTDYSRMVNLKSETSGRVEAVLVEEGRAVKEGEVIVRLAMDDRGSQLSRAQALVDQYAAEYEAARRLNEKGHRSATQLAAAHASLENARAELARVKLNIAHTEIHAPFDGVLQKRPVEVGDFVDIGDVVAEVVDLDPTFVVGSVSERDVGRISVGTEGTATLVTGQALEGTIRFISRVADTATRTFRVEMEAPNPDNAIVAGVTADISLPTGEVRAHLVSPSVLTLDPGGDIGVKIVDANDRVAFVPVTVVDDTLEGVWLTGLPARVRLITVGQEFVQAGQTVAPQEAARTASDS